MNLQSCLPGGAHMYIRASSCAHASLLPNGISVAAAIFTKKKTVGYATMVYVTDVWFRKEVTVKCYLDTSAVRAVVVCILTRFSKTTPQMHVALMLQAWCTSLCLSVTLVDCAHVVQQIVEIVRCLGYLLAKVDPDHSMLWSRNTLKTTSGLWKIWSFARQR